MSGQGPREALAVLVPELREQLDRTTRLVGTLYKICKQLEVGSK